MVLWGNEMLEWTFGLSPRLFQRVLSGDFENDAVAALPLLNESYGVSREAFADTKSTLLEQPRGILAPSVILATVLT